jgi:hypothetical protein
MPVPPARRSAVLMRMILELEIIRGRVRYPAVPRPILLIGTFLVLAAALGVLWTQRFEQVPGTPVRTLADLRAGAPVMPGVEWLGSVDRPTLRLTVMPQQPGVAMRLVIPGAGAAEMLHFRYRVSARSLIPGSEKWQTGRILVEWHCADGSGRTSLNTVAGAMGDEQKGWDSLVASPAQGPAWPALRVEHLGLSGELELADMEITEVRERPLWRYGRVPLVLAWFAWFFGWIRSWPRVTPPRALAAASVWLFVCIQLAIPGPWEIQKPMIAGFNLGAVPRSEATNTAEAPPSVATGKPMALAASGAVTASGKIPPGGGLLLQAKNLFARIRPVLHVLMLALPALASAWLVGSRPTVFPAVFAALAIEGAQTLFGYGFDWIDVTDLLCNAAGIALGLWLAERKFLLRLVGRFFPGCGAKSVAG